MKMDLIVNIEIDKYLCATPNDLKTFEYCVLLS